MVAGSYIKCDMCDAVFKFRLQLDKSVYAYELPIGIKCPGCGNTFDCRFSYKHGILPKQYAADTEDEVDYSLLIHHSYLYLEASFIKKRKP